MFRRRAGLSDDDEDDEPSEATIQLNAKMTAEFRKAFPLRSESHLRRAIPVAATPSLSQISRRINFDDSLNSSSTSPNIKVLELKEEVDSLRRQLSNAQSDIKRLKSLEEKGKEQADLLQSEISGLKRELIKQSRNDIIGDMKQELSEIVRSRDEWREASGRFHRYFQCAKARLLVAEQELRCKGYFPGNLGQLLIDASSTLGELEANCVQQATDDFDVMDRTQQDTDRSAHVDDEDASMVFDEPEEHRFRESISPIPSFGQGDETMASNQSVSILLNSTLANTSIDYEKDERIQRLELENSRLEDRIENLINHSDRAQKSMLMEEKKNNAEQKYALLEKNMENILAELNSLRSACSKKLFDIVDTSPQGRSAEVIKRIQSLNDTIESLQAQLGRVSSDADVARKEVEELRGERDVLCGKIEHLLAEEKKAELLCSQKEVLVLQDELKAVESKLVEANAKVGELQAQLQNTSKEPTDAGDETQIFHLRMNPMQGAVDALEEAERERLRKRKADTTANESSYEAKRAKDERISELESQLKKSEREKEQTIRLQADLTKKFRDMTCTLTGYQIKLKDVDEGICYVNSVYDEEEKQFVFKINEETGIVDLLDVGQDVLSQGRMWEEEMRKYIGERHSIPGFLAAVTLQLESRRDLEEVEPTHTFSVLH
ncbi:unnamed protein product [Nippostrongylus brasiliensis]|uniref:MDF-1 (inferred by orthology to a C. elegans protein) n=1 Tax=Nippostrongylus brasiliensis TaxID=27835 RepID=A0A0N4YE31_NIPBR|nr:unnamed protein product [Nippostrongylus brasiliensis]